jgi:hypothetical protein
MRRLIAIAVAGAGASLGGCSSMPSFSMDMFKSTPPTMQVQLESAPPGADATTSLGPSCKTPCSVSVPAPDQAFSVSYALNKYQPATVQVQVVRTPGNMTDPATATTDPNPVFAELQPVGPPPKAAHKKPMRKKPKTAAAPAAAGSDTSFPDPNAAPPPGNTAPSR